LGAASAAGAPWAPGKPLSRRGRGSNCGRGSRWSNCGRGSRWSSCGRGSRCGGLVAPGIPSLGPRPVGAVFPAVGAECRAMIGPRAVRAVVKAGLPAGRRCRRGFPAHGRAGRLGGRKDLDPRLLRDRLRRDDRGGGLGMATGFGNGRGGCRGGFNFDRLGSRRARGLWARERILVLALVRDDFDRGGLVVALRRASLWGPRRPRGAFRGLGPIRGCCRSFRQGSRRWQREPRIGGRCEWVRRTVCICHCVFVLYDGAHRKSGAAVV
jgi:hypothetical protein